MSFLRRTRAKTLSSVEEIACSKLSEAYSKMLESCGSEGDNWDLQTPEGAAACSAYLQEIDAASQALRVGMSSRDYRENFTVNYQVLFPGENRHYRLDILTACTEQYSGIWLNGTRYDFSVQVTKFAEALMQAWTELSRVLGAWGENKDKGELKKALLALDEAWARFEHNYILGLMGIEDQARQLVRDAISQERKLEEMEDRGIDSNSLEYCSERSKFVDCISQLNAVANVQRKGRTDLSADILSDALKLWRGCDGSGRPKPRGNQESFNRVSSVKSVSTTSVSTTETPTSGMKGQFLGILRSVTNSRKNSQTPSKVVRFFNEEQVCDDDLSNASTASSEEHLGSTDLSSANKDSESQSEESGEDTNAAQCIAGDVVESYWHMRYYLRDISNSLERLDPNLSSNAELVSRLEDWEESWEVGRDYVHDVEMLSIVCELVNFLKKAEKLEPALAEMTEECGAEFCMCLPRLVWLCFLQNPQRHMKLLQRFLPHRFIANDEANELIAKVSSHRFIASWDLCISDLLRRYRDAQREAEEVADEDHGVNRLLVQRVVAGPNSDAHPSFAKLDIEPKSDCNDFVHAIEERSIELQRHQPETWNHFMMVIVRCFSDGKPKHRERMGPKAPVPKMPSNRRSVWRRRPRLRTLPVNALACPARNS